ncbi:MAG: leucine-rich repeat domain-containing protein [Treponema sp.]|nr:leucine-rich repeat domain-containing protein [Treponema sp.]
MVSVILPDSVTSIGVYAFMYTSLLTIDLPDSVTSIGASAIRQCTSLTTIDLPDSLQTIANYAFYKCTSLTTLDFPDSLQSIGGNAFDGCSSLTTVTLRGSTPPSLDSYAILGWSALTAIYVPEGSVDAYKAANGWSAYADKIQAGP